MLPQISSDIHYLPSKRVVDHKYKSSKYQPYGRNVIEILLKSSWNTHLKHSNPYTFILKKVKKPPYGFHTHLFFASEIILIFGGIFLHRISRLLKLKFKRIRVPQTEFSRQIWKTRRENPNLSNPSWKARKKTLKFHKKIHPLFSAQFKMIGYAKYSIKQWNSQKKLDLTLMGHRSYLINMSKLKFDQRKTCLMTR